MSSNTSETIAECLITAYSNDLNELRKTGYTTSRLTMFMRTYKANISDPYTGACDYNIKSVQKLLVEFEDDSKFMIYNKMRTHNYYLVKIPRTKKEFRFTQKELDSFSNAVAISKKYNYV